MSAFSIPPESSVRCLVERVLVKWRAGGGRLQETRGGKWSKTTCLVQVGGGREQSCTLSRTAITRLFDFTTSKQNPVDQSNQRSLTGIILSFESRDKINLSFSHP